MGYVQTNPSSHNGLDELLKLLPPQAYLLSYQIRLMAKTLLHVAAVAESVAHTSETYPMFATPLKMQSGFALRPWLLRVSERNPKVVNAELPKSFLHVPEELSLGLGAYALFGEDGAFVAFQSSKPVFQGPSTSYMISESAFLFEFGDVDKRHVFHAKTRWTCFNPFETRERGKMGVRKDYLRIEILHRVRPSSASWTSSWSSPKNSYPPIGLHTWLAGCYTGARNSPSSPPLLFPQKRH